MVYEADKGAWRSGNADGCNPSIRGFKSLRALHRGVV